MKIKKLVGVIAATLSISFLMTACVGGQTAAPTLSIPGDTGASQVSSASSEKEGSGVSAESKTSKAEEIKVKESDVEDNIKGLCEFLEGNYAVTGDKAEMSYDVLGALAGYKYVFNYNSKSVQVEVYEFELDNLGENAEEYIAQVKETGKLKILDSEIDAVMSDSGKYLMVYSDTNKEEASQLQKERVYELFKGFKK